ncbi:hypothetical protein MMIC_P1890 [Mariprofundus micogutta]|uniref:Uncharacterized protein n=1 Tax=Mariprofundus micogutta TaxID=1921010 RepID=A0A1L8CPV8_9PROT|nr:hypothetical protein [Mariprofundus micogutta]GAV20914.1 hypothetical protein MMIC_P1890 [Mariprofundus micogutta]
MTHQNEIYATNATTLLEKFYVRLKATGLEDEKQKEFLRGFMAAGLSTGLIDRDSFDQLIASAHEKVFGMSIPQKHYEKMMNGEETSFFDVPTYNRPRQKI